MKGYGILTILITMAACESESFKQSSTTRRPRTDASVDTAVRADVVSSDTMPSDAASNCGTVTENGECMGTTLRYCDMGELVTFDCATLMGMAQCIAPDAGLAGCSD